MTMTTKMIMMKRSRLLLIPVIACTLLLAGQLPARAVSATPSDETEVRNVVQTIFEQLKAGQYGALYDALPAASRSRISRERFSAMLQRSGGTYKLERLEVGAVRVSGDIAAVDTVMYGSVERPIQAEGKIVAQQYLVREEGRWRVATGDRATVQRFLAANPAFAKKFPIRAPRVFVKRDGRWVDLTNALRTANSRRAGQ
ncbi:MAG TPA: hypothetical protein VM095_11840 [Pyrinomonadaceae bacterium]|nr:hypothetical protein [Pyrinomonadaceae bacterium]